MLFLAHGKLLDHPAGNARPATTEWRRMIGMIVAAGMHHQ